MKKDTERYISTIIEEWLPIYDALSEETIALLHGVADDNADALAERFYNVLLKDPAIARHLSYDLVKERLSSSLSLWIKSLFHSDKNQFYTLAEQQYHIGGIHARIGIPVEFVQRGARQLKLGIIGYIEKYKIEKSVSLEAVNYAVAAIDMAIEMMSHAYAMSHDRTAKNEEAYRLYSLMNNVQSEHSKQKAALSNWESMIIYSLVEGEKRTDFQSSFSNSDFSLWFRHKCVRHFGDNEQTKQIEVLIGEVDSLLSNVDFSYISEQVKNLQDLLRNIRVRCQEINAMLDILFDEASHLQDGKDALTNLLSKRYLPIVLRNEVSLAMENDLPLSVAVVDIDHFKRVNDKWGHPIGDRALKHIANLLNDNIRASDYLFRYGGEEFIIILVESGRFESYGLLERIRRIINENNFEIGNGESLPITVSIGFAVHNGHPDYNILLNEADSALYEAKRQGRNRVEPS